MDDKKVPKSSNTFCCNTCDYYTSRASQIDRHYLTQKHIRITKGVKMNDKKVPISSSNIDSKNNDIYIHVCECGKKYKFRQGLHKHKKFCNKTKVANEIKQSIETPNNMVEFIINIVKSNEEIKQLMVDQMKQHMETQKQHLEAQKQLIEIVKEPRNMINSNNTQNNHFNIQFFLNETCKDAINVSDFIENIKIDFDDVENVGRKGYITGITDMIVRNLSELGMTKRPFHCTDIKRETIYIKDNDKWDKDNEIKEKFQKVLNQIYDKNWNTLRKWSMANPDIRILDSRENKLYHKIIEQTDCIRGLDKLPETNEKIIRKISEIVKISKD